MSILTEHLVELLERRRLLFEQTYAHMTVDPVSGKPGWVPPDPYPAGVTEEDLTAFTSHTGIELPDDVIEWLKITNGAPGFLGIGAAQRGCNMEKLWQLAVRLRRKGWIPVGRDDFGNYYVRVVRESGGRGGVLHVEGTSTDELAYAVASDTLHFAVFSLEEKEALNSGETYGWPGDKSFVLSKDPELAHVEGARFLWDS